MTSAPPRMEVMAEYRPLAADSGSDSEEYESAVGKLTPHVATSIGQVD